MAEADSGNPSSLSEQYLLKEKEDKLSVEKKEIETIEPVAAESEAFVPSSPVETSVTAEHSEGAPAASEGNNGGSDNSSAAAAAKENTESVPSSGESVEQEPPVANEESKESAEQENSGDQEGIEDKPEIKLETAPADFRFPTTNQTRHCFTKYIEYHRCIAVKGEGAPECDKFAKSYRSLCPGEWIDRWNEQRENGVFPGPL